MNSVLCAVYMWVRVFCYYVVLGCMAVRVYVRECCACACVGPSKCCPGDMLRVNVEGTNCEERLCCDAHSVVPLLTEPVQSPCCVLPMVDCLDM